MVKAWLGVDLPEVNSLANMDLRFPLAFFEQVATKERQRALAAVSCPGKVAP